MADNNSLTDMMSDGVIKFTDLLNSSGIEFNNAQNDKAKTKAKIDELDKKQNKTDSDKATMNRLQSSQSSTVNAKAEFSKTDSNQSLFDRFAVIDYARYNRPSGEPWVEFKHDGNFNFTTNNGRPINVAVEGDTELEREGGLTIPHLISWSEKYPALQLRFQDFVYCKKLNYLPNNRLIVLRRFKHGVPDNLFDYHLKSSNSSSNAYFYNQPLSTMVTWLDPDVSPINFNFNENWGRNLDGLGNFLKDNLDIQKQKDSSSFSKFINLENSLTSIVLDFLGGDFSKQDGSPYLGRSIDGNPNLITSAIKRSVGTGEENLKSSIQFTLTFEYEMRYIPDVDPGIALLDILSNCFRMGTSVSEFKYPISFLKDNTAIEKIIYGEFELGFDSFTGQFKKFIDDVEKKANELISKVKNGATSLVSDTKRDIELAGTTIAQHIISRYRENLKAALATDTGLPSGVWHVTIGNPKNPIVSCGDLYVSSSSVELGKELGYNDFPNSFSCTYTLTAARPRGRDELERIFNAGRGRVYVYPNYKMNPDYDSYISDMNALKNNKK